MPSSEPTAAPTHPQEQGRGGRGRAGIVGVGAALPRRKVDNSWFEASLDTSDEWIQQRTGIQSRHIASEDAAEGLRQLMTDASEEACLSCKIGGPCDLVLVASTTPSDLFGDAPYVAEVLAKKNLVRHDSGAFDVRAGCNGFLVAMVTAAKYLESDLHKRILVVGGETFSHWLDWTDRSTCVLFGDGAGAVVMELSTTGSGLLASALRSHSSDCLSLPLKISAPTVTSPSQSTHASDSGSLEGSAADSASSCQGSPRRVRGPAGGYGALQMSGSDVFKFVTTEVPLVIRQVLADAGYSAQDPKWFLLHQANHRILQVVADELGVPSHRMLCNIQNIGNVGAASLPLLFKDGHESQQLQPDDLVVVAAFGAGLSWGAAVLRWGELGSLPLKSLPTDQEVNQDTLPFFKRGPTTSRSNGHKDAPTHNDNRNSSSTNSSGRSDRSNEDNQNSSSTSSGSSNRSSADSPSNTPTIDEKVIENDLTEAIDATLRQVHPELYEDGDLTILDVCDSLSSMLFGQKLSKALGGAVSIPPTILLECDTLEEVATFYRALITSSQACEPPSEQIAGGAEVEVSSDAMDYEEFPCTPLQRSMLLKATSDPTGDHFLESFVWRVSNSSNIDIPALQKAFLHVVQRHPSLRSSFLLDFEEGVWPRQRAWNCQISGSSLLIGAQRVDPPTWFQAVETTKDAYQVGRRVAAQQRAALRQLTTVPLFRMALVSSLRTNDEDSPERATLVLTIPHVLVDGVSMSLVLTDLRSAYSALAGAGRSSSILETATTSPSCSVSYKDYAVLKADPALIAAAAEHLKQCVGHARPVRGVPGPLVVSDNFNPVRCRLRAEGVSRLLSSYARCHHVTPAALLHAAFAIVWNQLLEPGREESETILVGSTVAARSHPLENLSNVVGLFVNVVPVAIALKTGGFAETLQEASKALLTARHFERVPLATAMESAGCGQEIQVIFDYQDEGSWMQVPLSTSGDDVNKIELFDGELVDRTGMPLSVRATRDGDDILLSATLETNQLPTSTAAWVVHGLHNVLSIVAALGSAQSPSRLSKGPATTAIRPGLVADLPLAVLTASLTSVCRATMYSFSRGADQEDEDEQSTFEQPKAPTATSPTPRTNDVQGNTADTIATRSTNGTSQNEGCHSQLASGPSFHQSSNKIEPILRTGGQNEAKTCLQELLSEVVADVLGLPGGGPSLDLQTNLRTLGFDSLRAMRALGLLRGRGLKVSLRELLAAQTIEELSSKAVASVPPSTTSAGPGPKILGSVKGELEGGLPFPLQTLPREEGNQPYPLFGVGAAHFVGLHASSFTSSELGQGGIAPQIYWEWIFGEDGAENSGQSQVDVDKLEAAFDLLVERHPTLRATVLEDGRMFAPDEAPGRCRAQVVAPWEGNAEVAQAAALRARAAMSGGGDAIGSPHEWPLFAFRITHVGPKTSVVHLAISLFLMDAVSDLVFRAELSKAYRALTRCEDPQNVLTPAPAMRFGDYCRSLVEGLPRSSSYAAARQFWDEKIQKGLPGGPALPRLPRGGTAEAGKAFNNASKWFSKTQWEQVKENCARYGVTIPTALLTAYCLALLRHQENGAEPRFLINVLLCLRYPVHEEMDRVLGNCSSTILVDINLGGEATTGGGLPSFQAAAKLVATSLSESLEHSTMSGVEVMEAINRSRRSTFSAVAPFIFTTPIGVEKGTGGDAQQRDWCFREQFFSERVPHTACVNAIKDDPATGGACASMDIVSGAFPEDVSSALTKTYSELLSILSSEDAKAWQTPSESHLERFEAAHPVAPPVQLEGQLLLQEGLLATAERWPDAPAVIAAGGLGQPRQEVSYRKLLAKSCSVARDLLAALGGDTKPPSGQLLVVAIVMAKSWQQVVAVHAVLLAGGAYLPTEPRLWPEARVKSVLEVSGAQAALATSRGLAEDYSWLTGLEIPVVSMSEDLLPSSVSSTLANLPARRAAPSDPAYLIYTSGSSGKPKGVVCHHLGAVNTLRDLNNRWKVTKKDRCLALSSLAFDLSVYDIFGLLAAGGSIVVPPASAMSPPDPELWAEIATAEKVSLWNSVPAFVDLLVAAVELCDVPLPSALRLVFMSGDWIPLQLPQRLSEVARMRASAPELKIVSMGGATEAAIWSNQYELTTDGSLPTGWASVPYGVPLQNQTMYILSEPSLEHAAPWVIGVIYIGGLGVASGYHNDDVKTAAQFITHPRTGEKLFRTGDLGRLRGGLLEICGREDAQVKLNGFRVELGEIEVALLGPLEDDAGLKVVAAATSVQDGQLCAHLVLATTDGEESLAELETQDKARWGGLCQELRARCVQKLPQYMVPAFFGTIPALPLSANGKLQRDKLPRPLQLQAGGSAYEAANPTDQKEQQTMLRPPLSSEEYAIRRAMASILSLDEATICCDSGDFFALGGSSVTALRLLFALRDDPELKPRGNGKTSPLTIRDLLAGATVAKLTSLIKERREIADSVAVEPEESTEQRGELELLTLAEGSKEETPLILINPAGASCLCYMELAKTLQEQGFSGPILGLDDGGVMRDDGVVGFKSIEEAATAVVSKLTEAAGGAPRALLAGWSYGGVIALEATKALAKQASNSIPNSSRPPITGLLLFDSPLAAAVVGARPGDGLAGTTRPDAVTEAPTRHFAEATKLLRAYHANGGAATDLTPLSCRVLDLRPLESDPTHPPEAPFDWSNYGCLAQQNEVPGSHWTLLSKSVGVEVVAETALRWMDEHSLR